MHAAADATAADGVHQSEPRRLLRRDRSHCLGQPFGCPSIRAASTTAATRTRLLQLKLAVSINQSRVDYCGERGSEVSSAMTCGVHQSEPRRLLRPVLLAAEIKDR